MTTSEVTTARAMTTTEHPIREWLDEQWRELQDSRSSMNIGYFQGAIDALVAAKVLMAESGELWMRRAMTCPEADQEHIGGRAWCAYCGDVPAAEIDPGDIGEGGWQPDVDAPRTDEQHWDAMKDASSL